MIGAASGRMGTRPIPTALSDIIGTFKSLTQNEYAHHVRNNGWPPFRKRLWQLRFHDHIIRNETELNRIQKYIIDNPKNWAEDDNNLENIRKNNETDSQQFDPPEPCSVIVCVHINPTNLGSLQDNGAHEFMHKDIRDDLEVNGIHDQESLDL